MKARPRQGQQSLASAALAEAVRRTGAEHGPTLRDGGVPAPPNYPLLYPK